MADPVELRVMVVDDEPLAVERLQLLLARCPGATVVGTANDGEAALRIAEAVTPDLVLLDIAMPGMDGIDVARDRKSTRLNSSHLVISYAVFCLKKKKSKRHRRRADESTIQDITC